MGKYAEFVTKYRIPYYSAIITQFIIQVWIILVISGLLMNFDPILNDDLMVWFFIIGILMAIITYSLPVVIINNIIDKEIELYYYCILSGVLGIITIVFVGLLSYQI